MSGILRGVEETQVTLRMLCASALPGHEAVRAWEMAPYDLILMDVRMPEMDGLEATRTIRRMEISKETHIPIIALTAHATDEDKKSCFNAGVDSYLTKPVLPGTLIETIRKVLAKDSSASPAPCAP
jgi:CheY-like chemotaxis protein